jgi:hypothetical protein
MNYFYLNINEYIGNINIGTYKDILFVTNFDVMHYKF